MEELNTMRDIDVERLAKAVEMMDTTDIKGKEYAEVPEKVKAFRFLYPRGQIRTVQMYLTGEEPNRVVGYHCEVFDDDGRYLADGDAEEKEGSTFINRTSFIENCQTSAIGRALSFVGLIKGKSVASYEEVANAQANQKPMATPAQVQRIIEHKEELIDKLKELGIRKPSDIKNLTVDQASHLLEGVNDD